MRPDVDIIIIGAGLAGLLLAERLALSGQRRLRVEVLEQGVSPTLARRSWSWYEAGRSRLAFDAVWHRWTVGAGHLSAGSAFAEGRYVLLRGDTLAERAMAAIAASPAVTLRSGLSVLDIRAVPGGARVDTSGGNLSAGLVIDTRPGGAELLSRAQWVRTGVRAEIRTGSACFDPSSAVLVHRLRRDGDALAFETLLPLAPDHAIIEAVRIARPGDERRADFDRAAHSAVDRASFEAGPRMRSASPMGVSDYWPAGASPAVLAASRGAGLALAGAAGRDARRSLAWLQPALDAIENGRAPGGLQGQPALARLAGQAVLQRLFTRPYRLIPMAERTSGDRLVRTLTGSGKFTDALHLLWAGR